jgi:hypothetical protein
VSDYQFPGKEGRYLVEKYNRKEDVMRNKKTGNLPAQIKEPQTLRRVRLFASWIFSDVNTI